MYKLLIVEDEAEVRYGIRNNIDWTSIGFEVMAEAGNGREALDLIENSKPDVVITDITMPIMDGLELSCILKKEYPTIRTIILTGYDDFKFAQRAIKYGVSDYLLKPVLPDDLSKLMRKIKDEIDAEIAEKEDIKKLRVYYQQSLPIIKDKFLTSLITSRIDSDEIESKKASLALDLKGEGFAAAAASIDSESAGNWGNDANDSELLKFAILNISQEIIKRYSMGETFFHVNNLVFILKFDKFDYESNFQSAYTLLEEIRQSVEKYLKVTITLGVGSICNSLQKISESYKSAVTALDYKLIMGGNRVIYIGDIEPQITYNLVYDEKKERNLINSIKFGSKNDVSKAVEALFNEIGTCAASLKECQLYLLEIIASVAKLSRSFQLDTDDIINIDHNLFIEIFSFDTISDIKKRIEEICLNVMERIQSNRKTNTEKIMEQAKAYIDKNYGDYDLTIQKISNYLHISPSYFSMIFKKEAGETFLNYLIGIRINAAKELMQDPDLKIFEIAERVGYPDLNYFSYFFKKNTGMSPREYRNKYVLNKERKVEA
ncbi:MAG TPA: DNA-binding response regulator [Ruminiclostridium sp.]|jgi:two-component system response regulator YesN|nr:response regulator transcription factor [Clostridiaceae bacterium]HAA25535.1 DNA-binding response regulator [Ruminiclostridium sp.]